MRPGLPTDRYRVAGAALICALVLALAACQAPAPDEQEAVAARAQQDAANAAAPAPDTSPQAPPIGSCDATQVQSLVGQALNDAATAQAREDSASASVRVLRPDQHVTMEFDGERLNIEVDAHNVVVSVRCG